MYPWLDRRGHLSPLKAIVFALLFLPAGWTLLAYAMGALGGRPLKEAIDQLGLWAIRFLFISLAITPLCQVLQWPAPVLTRRMIGVAAFSYTVVHLVLYAADQAFDVASIASEIVLRIYLTIGFAALLGLTALAATSTDAMVRCLGGRNWQRLHRLAYAIAVLAIVHYFMQRPKLDLCEPMVIAGFFAWLMGYRAILWTIGTSRIPVWSMGLLGIAAGALTAFGEAIYFHLGIGVDLAIVLSADFSPATGLRPGWIVLLAGGLVTATWQGAWSPPRRSCVPC